MATVHRAAVVYYLRRIAAGAPTAAVADAQLLARFAGGRDETAFATLVQRHGEMVLGVCRRVSGDWHTAEDAFQATFLVLARKAGSLRRPERLAAWLHGVAQRTARKARAEAARRRAREHQVARPTTSLPCDDLAWSEVLDEEIGRLPDRNRIAFVLCYLEGKTNAEAALLLGCSRGSVATLLARARERLRRRLGQRGLAPPAGAATMAVPALLANNTVRAALASVCGQGVAAATSVAALAEGVVRSMMLSQWKIAGIVLFLAALAGIGVGVTTSRGGPVQAAASEGPATPQTRRTVPPPPLAREEDEDEPSSPVRTEHFLVTAPTPAVARKVALAAERLRKELAVLWLGKELPPWPDLLPIRVTINSAGVGGATSFNFDQRKVRTREMHLEGPLDALLENTLPHEMTHVILAHWARRPLPRWADEGAAILSESDRERAKHLRALADVIDPDRSRMIPLRRLFSLEGYPRDVLALYTEGLSVVGYLVEQGGRAKFLAFLKDGMGEGWDESLNEHYDIRTVADLEREWIAHVRQQLDCTAPTPAGTLPRTESARKSPSPGVDEKAPQRGRAAAGEIDEAPEEAIPAGPGPAQAIVELGEDGRLTVWRGTMAYRLQELDAGGKRTQGYVPVNTITKSSYRRQDVKVYDMRGRPIPARKLRDLLQGQTIVLISEDGQGVNPLHLRLYKDGTLLFVLPPGTPPTITAPVPARAPVGEGAISYPPVRRGQRSDDLPDVPPVPRK